MLEIAVVIIAAIMIVANFELVIALAIWAAMLAAGLALLAGVICVFVTWPVEAITATMALVGICLVIAWDAKRQSNMLNGKASHSDPQ